MAELPPDFDWVTERKKCSVTVVFEQLRQDAERNVGSYKAGDEHKNWQVVSTSQEIFAVVGSSYGERIGVRFVLYGDAIEVSSQGIEPNVKMAATLTLNDAGQCRLLVDGQELERWQFLRRALEPLLFRPERR